MLTASSMGWKCHLFLFYGALASYVEGSWDEVNIERSAGRAPEWMSELQKGFELGNFPSLYKMLEGGRRESGGLHICACSTSCKLMELDLTAVREKVDEVVGLHTMMRIAEEARHVMYI